MRARRSQTDKPGLRDESVKCIAKGVAKRHYCRITIFSFQGKLLICIHVIGFVHI